MQVWIRGLTAETYKLISMKHTSNSYITDGLPEPPFKIQSAIRQLQKPRKPPTLNSVRHYGYDNIRVLCIHRMIRRGDELPNAIKELFHETDQFKD